jgi:transcription termination/antitermination protein NusG
LRGQIVRIAQGRFVDFVGIVNETNLEKGKVKVKVSVFGRERLLELDFIEVEAVERHPGFLRLPETET